MTKPMTESDRVDEAAIEAAIMAGAEALKRFSQDVTRPIRKLTKPEVGIVMMNGIAAWVKVRAEHQAKLRAQGLVDDLGVSTVPFNDAIPVFPDAARMLD